MVEVSDFNFVNNFALEDELPFRVVGFIDIECKAYVPPSGYIITSCEHVGDTVIGGTSRHNLSKIQLTEESFANSRKLALIFGAGLVVVLVVAAVITLSPPHLTYSHA